MAIDQIIQNYTAMTSASGTPGYNGGVTVDYDGELLTFKEADGDTYTVSATNLSESDINAISTSLNANVQNVEETTETEGTENVQTTSNDASSNSLEENKAKLQELKTHRETLAQSAETIQKTVETLSNEIQAEFDKALKEQEKITKEEQDRIKEFVQNQIAQFKKDKENGRDVSLNDLQATISTGLTQSGFDALISETMANLIATNSKMTEMDILLGKLGNINTELKDCDSQIADLEKVIACQEEEARKAAEAAAAAARSSCCDPIGFQGENGAKFEFVVDKDGNGALSNFSEFLGSENFFEEMVALDADKSGDVSTDELNQAGVKILVTEKDGTQSMKSLAEAFGNKDVNVDLDSYKEAAEGAKADNGQTLLGNFNINVGDSQYNGYSTLDTAEYLQSNYTFTDENPVNAGVTTDAAQDAKADVTEAEAAENDINVFIETYTAKLADYQTQFDQLTELLGLDEGLINSIREISQLSAEAEASSIIRKIEKETEEAETAKAEETEEAEEAEEAEKVKGKIA